MYDLRLVHNTDVALWQLELYDELSDAISKIRSFSFKSEDIDSQIDTGIGLQTRCLKEGKDLNLFEDVESFLQKVVHFQIMEMYNS